MNNVLSCSIEARNSLCDTEESSALFDGSGSTSSSGTLEFRWSHSCSSNNVRRVAVSPESIQLVLDNPPLNELVTCNAELEVSNEFGRKTCERSVTLQSCDFRCDSSDITTLLSALDGNSARQHTAH